MKACISLMSEMKTKHFKGIHEHDRFFPRSIQIHHYLA
ncbi:hypothetical protein CFter6_2201 [Collimonas fungivorans]|uniref:Uncharacterized protein n=1 Tax=Collimonas fungivorans TaxID=158899 RepID=A0A127PAN0_9BURK|nr:hypothetical protein CFter6_2201 [Collimonas fungivorans]